MSVPQAIKRISVEAVRITVKTYLSGLGPIGSMIEQAIFDLPSRISSKRIEQFIMILSDKVDEIDHEKINKTFFESDDFYDLTVNTFRGAMQTQLKKKHQMLASIYVSGIKDEVNWNADLSEVLIRLVNDLTGNHMIVLRFMADSIQGFERVRSYQQIFDDYKKTNNGLDRDIFRMCLKDFDRLSLINFSTEIQDYSDSATIGSNDFLMPEKVIPKVFITTLGRSFIQHLPS